MEMEQHLAPNLWQFALVVGAQIILNSGLHGIDGLVYSDNVSTYEFISLGISLFNSTVVRKPYNSSVSTALMAAAHTSFGLIACGGLEIPDIIHSALVVFAGSTYPLVKPILGTQNGLFLLLSIGVLMAASYVNGMGNNGWNMYAKRSPLKREIKVKSIMPPQERTVSRKSNDLRKRNAVKPIMKKPATVFAANPAGDGGDQPDQPGPPGCAPLSNDMATSPPGSNPPGFCYDPCGRLQKMSTYFQQGGAFVPAQLATSVNSILLPDPLHSTLQPLLSCRSQQPGWGNRS